MQASVKVAAQQEFDFRCRELQQSIAGRLDDYARTLQGGAAFFNAAGNVSREQWHIFVNDQNIEQQLPGIQAIGFNLVISPKDLQQHIQDIRAEGFPEYQVLPVGKRELYTALIYLEPFSGRNLHAFGYDTFAEPARRAAMERARDTGDAAMTAKITLVQERELAVQAGILIYVPVYRQGLPIKTLAQRQAAIYGWVSGPCRMNDLMQEILSSEPLPNADTVQLKIYDGKQLVPKNLLYSNQPQRAQTELAPHERLTNKLLLDFNGHLWTLEFSQHYHALAAVSSSRVWLTLIFGTILSLVAFAFIRNQHNATIKTQRIITERTASLVSERQRLASIISCTEVGTWEWDIQTGVVIINERWASLLGFTIEELAPASIDTWRSRVHPDDLSVCNSLLEEHFSGNLEHYYFETRMRHKDGHWVWVADSGKVSSWSKTGEPLLMFGTHTDITTRKEHANKIAFYNRVIESSLNEIYIFDSQTLQIIEANYGARLNLGYSLAELRTLTALDIKPEFNQESFATLVKPLLNGTTQTIINTTNHLRKDGTTYPVEVHLQLIDDEPPVFVAIILDLTQREKAYLEQERLLRALNQSGETIFITDHQGTIQYVNPAFTHITGYTAEEALGNNPRMLKSGTHDAEFYQQMWATLTSGNTWNGRLVNKKKDGSLYTEEAAISPVKNAAGTIVNYVAVKRDISEKIIAEQEHNHLEAQLRQKHKMEAVGYMAGGMAHNFNNNLSIILGNIELAQLKMSGHIEVLSLLHNAKTAVRRSRDLVKQIITYSRQNKLNRETIQLADIISETITLLRATLPTTVELKRVDSHASTSAFILADASQIQEILINLCNNAVQAMHEIGILTIGLDLVQITKKDIPAQYPCQPGQYVQLRIEDTGCGIPATMVDKIFDPFFTTKQKHEGAGMGLATVQGIVVQHNGLIKVDSIPEHGTTFSLYFPCVETSEHQAPAVPQRRSSRGGEHILLVDDNESLAELNEKLLVSAGYTVTCMTDSGEALKLFTANSHRFDLVITDQTMPKLTGQQLIHKLKQIHPQIRTILCTGYSSKTDTQTAEELGVNAFLLKPFDLAELSQTIRQILDNNSAST
ncbi:MAG: CHASE domain-containing protein [Desulfuromonas sp.]|nr:CHASE domain-containing protein [Desulfuromonas sp.]